MIKFYLKLNNNHYYTLKLNYNRIKLKLLKSFFDLDLFKEYPNTNLLLLLLYIPYADELWGQLKIIAYTCYLLIN